MAELQTNTDRSLAPDQLGTYIRVSKPSVWMLLGVIAALLTAGIVWFFAGSITERVPACALIREDQAVAYVPLSRASEIEVGDVIELARRDTAEPGVVTGLGNEPVSLDIVRRECGEDELEGFETDTWAVRLEIDAGAAQGAYSARVVTATHRPIRLLLGLD